MWKTDIVHFAVKTTRIQKEKFKITQSKSFRADGGLGHLNLVLFPFRRPAPLPRSVSRQDNQPIPNFSNPFRKTNAEKIFGLSFYNLS